MQNQPSGCLRSLCARATIPNKRQKIQQGGCQGETMAYTKTYEKINASVTFFQDKTISESNKVFETAGNYSNHMTYCQTIDHADQ